MMRTGVNLMKNPDRKAVDMTLTSALLAATSSSITTPPNLEKRDWILKRYVHVFGT